MTGLFEEEDEILDEGPFDYIKTAAKNIGSKIANSALGAAGSSKADGRLDVLRVKGKLNSDLKRYLGRNPGTKVTMTFLAQFLAATYGSDVGAFINQASARSLSSVPSTQAPAPDGSPSATPGSPTDATAAAAPTPRAMDPEAQARVKAERSAYAKMGDANGGYARNYQNKTMQDIYAAAQSPQHDMSKIVMLTKELVNQAADAGGANRTKAIAFLKTLKRSPGVQNDTRLYTFLDKMGAQMSRYNYAHEKPMESVTRSTTKRFTFEEFDIALRAAIYILETNATTKSALRESVSYILFEDGMNAFDAEDAKSSTSPVLSASQIDRLLAVASQYLLNSGRIDFHDGSHLDKSQSRPSGYQMPQAPSARATLSNNSQISGRDFYNASRDVKDRSAVEKVAQMIGRGTTYGDLKRKLGTTPLPIDLSQAITSSVV